jgi:hypothetical protein
MQSRPSVQPFSAPHGSYGVEYVVVSACGARQRASHLAKRAGNVSFNEFVSREFSFLGFLARKGARIAPHCERKLRVDFVHGESSLRRSQQGVSVADLVDDVPGLFGDRSSVDRAPKGACFRVGGAVE